MTTGRIVIVGRTEEDTGPLRQTLSSEGWDVRGCAGPSAIRCPLLAGNDCELRDWADAAIVYMDHRQPHASNVIKVRCAASSPAVVVLEGQVDSPRREGEFALVGSLRSSMGIVESLHDLTSTGPAVGTTVATPGKG